MRWPVVIGVAVAALVGAGVLAWTTIRQDREFQRLLAVGDRAVADAQTFTAIEAFSGALALKGDSMLPYLKRGDTYRRRGDMAAALRDLRRAADIEPTAPAPVELLGDVNAAMGRFDRAVEHYRRYVELDDRAPRVLYKLALTYYRHGQSARAIEPLRQAIAIDGRLSEAHYLMGLCLRDAGRPQDAVASLRRALDLNPNLAAAREALGTLFESINRRRESLEQFEALAALEPERSVRTVRVALAYARYGQTETALATLGRAAERYPDDPAVYTALGRLWLEAAGPRNDRVSVTKSLGALRVVAEHPDASSETLALYGRALYLFGSTDAAERVLQRATTRTPVDPVAYRYLSDAATRMRHPTVARAADVRYAALTQP
jgi:tetratricopeptide (TPR) repeat protein